MAFDIKLDKNKNIGKVVYIVEGQQKEITLLLYLYGNVLDYTVINVKRGKTPYLKFVSKNNINSQVYIITTYQSNVKTLMDTEGKNYLDAVFNVLYRDYGLDVSNSAVYYIFDRDSESNKAYNCIELADRLKNARDNGFEMNGLFLLSYPSIESYIKSCFDNTKDEYVKDAEELKLLTGKGKYQYNHINCEEIIKACNNMLLTYEDVIGNDFNKSFLDNFSKVNTYIIEYEDSLYKRECLIYKDKNYRILSLLSMSLIDLGVINIQDHLMK